MTEEERELVQQIYHENKGRYGYRRITKVKLKGLTPLQFRNQSLKSA